MMQRMIARMMALILMVNLVLCVPLSVRAEGTETETFEADAVTVETTTEGGSTQTNVVVTETVSEGTVATGSGVAVKDQTVSVEIPVEEATTLTPVEGQTPTANTDGTAIEYDTTAPTEESTITEETIHVEESYDLKVEVTDAEKDASGQLTDIEYDVSLEQEAILPTDAASPSETETQAQTTSNSGGSSSSSEPDTHWEKPVKVNLSVNGMEDAPTRVEHKYTDESGKEQTEYYYNAKQVEEGSNKKTFTVTVKEVAEAVTEKVVSLWTNFLGIFHITNDAFENQDSREMSTTLDEAVNNAANGSTVQMLRDYTTDKSAVLYNSGSTGDDVSVDFNQHTYEFTGSSAAAQIAGNGQTVQFQNGTMDSNGDGIYIWYDGNTLTLDNATIDADGYYGILSYPDEEDNSCNATVNMRNDSSVNSNWCGVYMKGDSNTLNAGKSNISGSSYGIIVYDKDAKVMLSGSKVSGDVAGIYSSGTSQSLEVKNNSSITTSGTGINVWGTQNSYSIENSTINYGSYGVELHEDSNTLNVKDSMIGGSDQPGKWGIATFGSGQKVNLSGSTVNASQMGFYATGENHHFEVTDASTINSDKHGINFQNAPSSTLLFKDSEINADYGLYAGTYLKNSDDSYTPLLGNYTLTFKNSAINGAAQGLEVFGNRNTINMGGTTIKAGNIGILDGGKKNTYTITDSSIFFDRSADSMYSYGITHNGSNGGAKFTLTNTTIDPGKAGLVGIYISGSTNTAAAADTDGLNELILKGGTIAGYQSAVEVKFTDVTMDGSTLKGLGNPPYHIDNSNGTTTAGAALAVTDNSDGKTGGTIIIHSGNFYGHKDIDNIYQAVKETSGDDMATITILGGRYVNTRGLYPFIPEGYATISHNDGSEYIYEVVAKGYVPTRSGYVFMGYKDSNGNDITLQEAFTQKVVAYAQWEPAPEPTVETPKAEENNKKDAIIIVEPDTMGNNVDVTIQGTTAQVTVSTPNGDAAGVSEVIVTSVEQLREQGVETICVQVEENVTLELGVAKDADNGLGDTIVITRNEDTLVISSGEETNITIHMEALKAASTEAVHIRYDEGVITVSFGSTVVFRMEVLEALRANKDLTVKLEGRVLKLYDKNNNLIQQIPM